MTNFLDKIRNGELYTREEYSAVINDYPDNVFKVRPAELPKYPSRVNAEQIYLDLRRITNPDTPKNKWLTIGSERITFLTGLKSKLENLMEEIKPLSNELYNITYDDIKIILWDTATGVEDVSTKTIKYLIEHPDIIYINTPADRLEDVSRYINIYKEYITPSFYSLLGLEIQSNESVAFDALALSFKNGNMIAIITKLIDLVSKEILAIEPNKKVLLIDNVIDKHIPAFMKLLITIKEK